MINTRSACTFLMALCVTSGCAAAPAMMMPDPPEVCPIRNGNVLRDDLLTGTASFLRIVGTYEVIARLANREDLLVYTDRAKRRFETVRTQLRDGRPVDEDMLWNGVYDLKTFERLFFRRE